MLASFVIGFHTARADNLLQTLRFLIQDHLEVVSDSYLSLVCQNDCDTLPGEQLNELETLREKFHRSCILNLNLKNMHLPYVTNVGVEDAETDKIIILESDRLLPPGYFMDVINQLEEGVQITCLNMKKLTKTATDEEIRQNTFEYVDEHRDPQNRIGMRSVWSGNTAIMKSDYYRVGKMDEKYVGYGWADSDMTATMEKGGVKSVFRPEIELHLWHAPATYGEGDQKQLFINNGLHFCKKWGHSLPDWFRQEIAQHKKVMI